MAVGMVNLFGWKTTSPTVFYYICLVLTVATTLGVLNLLRSATGRAFVAIRDSEVSAQSMGVNLARYKTLSFAVSAALAGLGGALSAHMLRFISPDQFGVIQSIDLLLIVIVGGLGSIHGAFFGALFLIATPQMISLAKDFLPASIGHTTGLQSVVYGLILIAFVLFEPLGIYGRWVKIRTWFELAPLYRKGLMKRQKSFQKTERLH
jgi:branched-chain amino acid transport system permease protein